MCGEKKSKNSNNASNVVNISRVRTENNKIMSQESCYAALQKVGCGNKSNNQSSESRASRLALSNALLIGLGCRCLICGFGGLSV